MNGVELELWRERLLSRYDATTTVGRIGFVLARTCDRNGAAWISVRSLRVRMVAIWPELLEGPRRGRRATGISHDWLRRTLATHPDWLTVGQVRYPDRRLGPSLRLLVDSVRHEIGLSVTVAEARKRHTEKAPGEGAWLSQIPQTKRPDTTNQVTRTPKDSREQAVIPGSCPAPTTLDDLVVAGEQRGLEGTEVVRLMLGYRDGETAAETVARMFPRVEQLEFQVGGERP